MKDSKLQAMRRNKPKLTLIYFAAPGRAEACRLAAAAGGVPFTNRIVNQEEFMELKPNLPLGQLPVLEIEMEGRDEKLVLPQSDAILRYIGKLGGLYPDCPIEAAKIDALMLALDDLVTPLIIAYQGLKKSLLCEHDSTEDDKIAIRKRVVEELLPQYMGLIEKTLSESDSGWLVGKRMTIADLKVHDFTAFFASRDVPGIDPSCMDAFPLTTKLAERVKEIPAIAAWYEKKGEAPYSTFVFEP